MQNIFKIVKQNFKRIRKVFLICLMFAFGVFGGGCSGCSLFDEVEHTHNFSVEKTIQQGDCTTDNVVEVACSCGEKEVRVEKAIGHQYEVMEVIQPTCENDGQSISVCKNCQDERISAEDKLTHNYQLISKDEETLTYSCEYCKDEKTILKTENILEETKQITYLFDCEENFTFTIQTSEEETYIRENLSIVNTYFEEETISDASYMSDEESQTYQLEQLTDGCWRVSYNKPYEAGNTYTATVSNNVKFNDYKGSQLQFSIIKEETIEYEEQEGIIYIKTLEKSNPGYYPYTIDYSEEANCYWLELGKVDGFKQGDIICVGNAESMDEVINNLKEKNYYGKVSSIVPMQNGKYLVGLETPGLDEVFDELEIYTQQELNFEETEFILSNDFEKNVVKALVESDGYAEFLGASSMAAVAYLGEKGFNTDAVKPMAFKVGDGIIVRTPTIKDGSISVVVDGEWFIPIETKSGTSLGQISVSFSTSLKAGFTVTLHYREEGVFFELRVTQTSVIDFTFNIDIDVDYSLDGEIHSNNYVLNNKSKVYHCGNCKHVTAIKDKSVVIKISKEDILRYHEYGIYDECNTCNPYNALTSTTYIVHKTERIVHVCNCPSVDLMDDSNMEWSSLSWQKLKMLGYSLCQNCQPESREEKKFEDLMWDGIKRGEVDSFTDKIKEWSQSGKQKDDEKKFYLGGIPVYLYGFSVKLEVYFVFEFDFNVEMDYKYHMQQVATMGLVIDDWKVVKYRNENHDVTKNELKLVGEIDLKTGLEADLTVRLMDCDWVKAGIGVGAGFCLNTQGVLETDFAEKEYFAAARVEIQAYFNCDYFYRLPWKEGGEDLIEGKKTIKSLGYDYVYYNYVDIPQEINISENYTLKDNELLNVKYLYILSMQYGTKTLNRGNKIYTVNYRLQDGTYCSIQDDEIIIADNAPKEFKDVLYVSVSANNDFSHYIKGSTAIFLDEYAVEINYSYGSKGLDYQLINDIQYEVRGIGTSTDNDMYIPSFYNNLPVTNIQWDAFNNCDTLISVVIGDGVTSIGGRAFANCDGLTSVTIGDSVTSIGSYAFDNCISLTSVVIPDSVTSIGDSAFYNCNSLTNVTMPNSLTSIGDFAFYNCDGLTSLKIPDLVTKIGDAAFHNCVKLENVTIGKSVTSIGDTAFYECVNLTEVVIPDSVTIIGYRAFYSCPIENATISCIALANIETSFLKSVIITSGKYIGDDVFAHCDNLTSVTIGNSVTSIGREAFYNCSNLTSIEIPNSVASIGESAFSGCSSLERVYITDIEVWCAFDFKDSEANPLSNGADLYINNKLVTELVILDTVTEIKKYAFYGCTSLTSVRIPTSVKSIGYEVFSYCSNLTSMEIPNSVITIGDYAFWQCSSLVNVTIGNSVTSIGEGAFSSCSSLTSVKIPNSVKIIKYRTFGGCSSLTDVEIPDSVTNISAYAFLGCSLKNIVIPDSVTNMGNNVFDGCSDLRSIVLGNSVRHIAESSFANCSDLETVYYKGTAEEWGKIFIDSYNELLNSATRYYYVENESNVPDDGGNYWNYDENGKINTHFHKRSNLLCNESRHWYECECGKKMDEEDHYGGKATCVVQAICTICEQAYGEFGQHEYSGENFCKHCGKVYYFSEGLEYRVLDGYCQVIGIGSCTDTDVVIPLFYEGVPVVGINDDAFYNCTSLTSVVISDSVTRIGDSAFAGCSSLTSIVIPSSVTNIGHRPFIGCNSLTGIYITDLTAWCNIIFNYNDSHPLYYANNLYLNGELLTELIIPDSVTSIGNYTFYNCTSLTSVVIPDSVTNIEDGAFSGCTSLTSVVIPDSVTSIENGAFYNCSSLEGLYITDLTAWCNINFSDYSSNPLYYADNLYLNGALITELIIPDSVTSVDDYMFYACESLTSVVITDSVTNIGSDAFSGCSNLTSIEISNSVKSIGDRAFRNCGNLTNIMVNESNTIYKSIDGNLYNKDGTTLIQYAIGKTATSAVIPNWVTSIGDYAFDNCISLTSVVIPDSVTSIGRYAFYNCSSLEGVYINDLTAWCNINFSDYSSNPLCYAGNLYLNEELITELIIPDSMTSIGDYAFYKCNSLTNVTIPNSLTSIGSYAFYECTPLTSVVIPDSVTSIGGGAFYIYDAVIYCEAKNRPATWDEMWCGSESGIARDPVVIWDYKNNDIANDGRTYTEVDGVRYALENGIAKVARNPKNIVSCNILSSITYKGVEYPVTCIDAFAFYDCSRLTSVTIPDSIVSIGADAFSECKSLKNIYITDLAAWCNISLNRRWGDNYGTPLRYGANLYLNGELITELIIPDSVTSIGGYAFYNCTSLTSVVIPDSATSIGDYAFYNCGSLANIYYDKERKSLESGRSNNESYLH